MTLRTSCRTAPPRGRAWACSRARFAMRRRATPLRSGSRPSCAAACISSRRRCWSRPCCRTSARSAWRTRRRCSDAYGAAGTVGIMMCDVLGITHPAALPHAMDLGMAMQLTNIARDVAEDAARNRLYLPADWLPMGFEPADVRARRPPRSPPWRASSPGRTGTTAAPSAATVTSRCACGPRYVPLPGCMKRSGRACFGRGRLPGHGTAMRRAALAAAGPGWIVPLPCPPAAPHDAALHAPLHGLLGAQA